MIGGAVVLVSERVVFIFMAKRFIDYAFKSKVLREHSDLIRMAKKASRLDYAINQYLMYGEMSPYLKRCIDTNAMDTNDLHDYAVANGLKKEFTEAYKINHASYKRTARLQDRVQTMLLSGSCVFLTLTFTDNVLDTTTEKERRVAVSRFLKSHGCPYVANIDFGAKNHREHYHALINTDSVDYAKWRNRFGSINGQRVRNKDIESDKTKLAKYICKLSNHAIKETTKRSTLIYSRV